MSRGILVADMQEGQRLEGVYLVQSRTLATTRAGKPFLTLKLGDRSGVTEGRVWDDAEKVLQTITDYDYVRVAAQVNLYNGKLQLNLKSVKPVDAESVEPSDFLPASSRDPDEMMAELAACIGKVKDKDFHKLLHTIFQDKELKARFRRAPAAKSMHHAYVGGLLEHTLSLFHLCERVIPHFPEVDASLLLSGALLHDLGKVDELSYARSFDYTDEGRLMGHIVLELERVSRVIAGVPGFPEHKAVLLKHLLVSHHGKEEFGSPVKPMTMEALVLNVLDDLDAKSQAFRQLMASGSSERWSPYHPLLGQFVFKGYGRSESDGEGKKEPTGNDPDHPRLF
ncbi:MAG: OB-fold nucleic acid binding domain-containing protein [bacterium]|nr:OB-fold nucleic acid binding domain-containing protein [bacterium]